jgi:hypothetical protein
MIERMPGGDGVMSEDIAAEAADVAAQTLLEFLRPASGARDAA